MPRRRRGRGLLGIASWQCPGRDLQEQHGGRGPKPFRSGLNRCHKTIKHWQAAQHRVLKHDPASVLWPRTVPRLPCMQIDFKMRAAKSCDPPMTSRNIESKRVVGFAEPPTPSTWIIGEADQRQYHVIDHVFQDGEWEDLEPILRQLGRVGGLRSTHRSALTPDRETSLPPLTPTPKPSSLFATSSSNRRSLRWAKAARRVPHNCS